jgi:hypothetical protein
MARNTTGHSGEKMVEAVLGFKGFTPLMAPAGNPDWDIMVAETLKKISVKASNSSGFVAEFDTADQFDVLAVVDAFELMYPRVWFIPRYEALKLAETKGKIRVNKSDLVGVLAQFEMNMNVL